MKEVINPGTPVAGPYSPGIKSGNNLFISGQGWPQESSDISEQTYQTLNNIKKIINTAGGIVSDNQGAAYIFHRDEVTDIWDTEVKIMAPDPGISDYFGYSVSISGDYTVVGAKYDGGTNIGAAYIITR